MSDQKNLSEIKAKIRRLEFATDEEGQKRIESLRRRAGVPNDTVLIRNALMLYEWYLDRQEEKSDLAIIKKGRTYKIDLKFD